MAHFSEKISTLSDTLHSYKIRLWSNYAYGTENAFFGKCFHPKKAKGEIQDEQF
jgi:hypothetical protein